jgi:hypothetical protein
VDAQTELEIVVESDDDAIVGEVRSALSPAEVEQWENARIVDPMTILAVAGGIVQIVNGLLTLRDRLRKKREPPTVRIRNAAGDEVVLVTATPEEIEALVAGRARAAQEGGT